MIRNAKVIENSAISKEIVSLGCKVKIKDVDSKEEEEYTVVGTTEADPMADPPKISNESPVGKAIIGQKVGKKVIVKTPAGEFAYKILEINKPRAKAKRKAK